MSKAQTSYQCRSCGYVSTSWYGKCPECQEWETFEMIENTIISDNKSTSKAKIVSFSDVNAESVRRTATGVFEFDRVVGSGFVAGEVVLLAGEPGVGKSTLLIEVLQKLKVLYVSGEESANQIKQRADRLGVDTKSFFFSSDTNIDSILKTLVDDKLIVDVVVIDSIQMVYSEGVAGTPGGSLQIKEVATKLIEFAKTTGTPVLLIGHITKDGIIAGPKTLEHLVDCVLYLEGERLSQFRILRSSKNRYGSTSEIGLFEMVKNGLKQVENPTSFLQQDGESMIGKVIVGVLKGSRTLFFEIQALVVMSYLPSPRRVVSGLDYNKVLLLLAVLQKNLKLPLEKYDIYVSVAGGVSTKSTATDLGVAVAIISSIRSIPISQKSVFVGEVSLLGEIKPVFQQTKIVKDATRYGFGPVNSSANCKTIQSVLALVK